MRYFLLALLIHLAFFLKFNHIHETLGDPNFSSRGTIPISYNVKNKEQRIDNIKKVKGSNEVAPKKEEVKKEKVKKKKDNDFKSKMKRKKEVIKKDKKKIQKKSKPKKLGNFVANSDGSYTSYSSKGIHFEILRQIDPDYPRQAEIIRYSKEVIVGVRFLVDTKGIVKDIKITKSHKKFGFDDAVIASLRKWRFKPIVFNGKKMNVYFNKEFVFKPKS
ncbi:MAG: energy transducer TonB [Fusobacterium sp. JB019]|nr:energy transducer TonB [Fusobacterium sp. JB020]MDP0506624.1 energy transducer TonB [Fusobacterium sp. JB019]